MSLPNESHLTIDGSVPKHYSPTGVASDKYIDTTNKQGRTQKTKPAIKRILLTNSERKQADEFDKRQTSEIITIVDDSSAVSELKNSIEDILCQTASEGKKGYLISETGRSTLNSKLYSENLIQTKFSKTLFNYRQYTTCGFFTSNLQPELNECIAAPITVPCTFIERFLDHSSLGVTKTAKNKVVQIKNRKGPTIFIDDDDDDKTKTKEIDPMNSSFLVKWKGLGEEYATWETYKTLSGKTPMNLCAANIRDFNRIFEIYSNKVVADKKVPNIGIKENMEPYPLLHNMTLNKTQTDIFNFFSKSFEQANIAVMLTEKGVGKKIATAAFINTIVNKLHHNKPTLIVTNDTSGWANAIRLATNLYYVEYIKDRQSRIVINQREISNIKNVKFNVCISTPDLFYTVCNIRWGALIFDESDKTFTPPQILWKHPTLKAYFFDKNIESFEIPQRVFNKEVFDNVCFKAKEDLVLVPERKGGIILQSLHNAVLEKLNYPPIVYLILLFYSHPLLISEIRQSAILERTQSLQRGLTSEEKVEMYGEFSSKFVTVLEVGRACAENKTCLGVVANGFNVLRLLHKFLSANGVPTTFLNSPIPSESFDQEFAFGVVLMTRDITSNDLDGLEISELIFYDICENIQTDININQFFSNKREVHVSRLLTNNTVETYIFSRLIEKGVFEAHELQRKDAEKIINHALAKDSSSDEESNVIVSVTYPDSFEEIENKFGETNEEEADLDLVGQIEKESDDDTYDSTESFTKVSLIRELIERIVKEGFACVPEFVDRFECSESRIMGIIVYTFVIIFSTKYTPANTFLSGWISLQLDLPYVTDSKEKFAELWRDCNDLVVKSYLESIRPESFFKLITYCDKIKGRIIYSAYKLISSKKYPKRFYFRKSLSHSMIKLDDLFPTKRQDTKFASQIVRMMISDTLSCAFHAAANEDLPMEIKAIKSIYDRYTKTNVWSEDETTRVLNMLSQYGIPFDAEGKPDGKEIVSLCHLKEKTPEDASIFTQKFLHEILVFDNKALSLVLPSSITNTTSVVEIFSENIMSVRPKVMTMMLFRKIIINPEKREYDTTLIPDSWSLDLDLSLFKVAAQYGIDAALDFFEMKFSENQGGCDVHATKEDIMNILNVQSPKNILRRRIAFIVNSYANSSKGSYVQSKPNKPRATKNDSDDDDDDEDDDDEDYSEEGVEEEEEEEEEEETPGLLDDDDLFPENNNVSEANNTDESSEGFQDDGESEYSSFRNYSDEEYESPNGKASSNGDDAYKESDDSEGEIIVKPVKANKPGRKPKQPKPEAPPVIVNPIEILIKNNEIDTETLLDQIRKGKISRGCVLELMGKRLLPSTVILQIFREKKVSEKNMYDLITCGLVDYYVIQNLLFENQFSDQMLPWIITLTINCRECDNETLVKILKHYNIDDNTIETVVMPKRGSFNTFLHVKNAPEPSFTSLSAPYLSHKTEQAPKKKRGRPRTKPVAYEAEKKSAKVEEVPDIYCDYSMPNKAAATRTLPYQLYQSAIPISGEQYAQNSLMIARPFQAVKGQPIPAIQQLQSMPTVSRQPIQTIQTVKTQQIQPIPAIQTVKPRQVKNIQAIKPIPIVKTTQIGNVQSIPIQTLPQMPQVALIQPVLPTITVQATVNQIKRNTKNIQPAKPPKNDHILDPLALFK